MQTFLDNLISIQWWLGVVFVGIIVNLFSRFIVSKFDNYLSKISAWWRNRSERRKNAFEISVNFLKSNPQELVIVLFFEARWMSRAIFLLLMGVLSFILGLFCLTNISMNIITVSYINYKISASLFYLFATIFMILSMLCLQISSSYLNLIRDARK